MKLDISNLPTWAKVELTKQSLVDFADRLLAGASPKIVEVTEEEILTIDEAAKFLKLAKQTIYQLTSKKALPFYKLNKRIYFKRSELLALIESGKQEVQSDLDDEVRNYLQNRSK